MSEPEFVGDEMLNMTPKGAAALAGMLKILSDDLGQPVSAPQMGAALKAMRLKYGIGYDLKDPDLWDEFRELLRNERSA